MTTAPARRPGGTAYRGAVYGLDVIDHESWMAGAPRIVPNDYRGKTRQRGRLRENQHRDDQPWSDLIVGSPRVLWEGICAEDELDRMERRFIQDPPDGMARPRLNFQMNEDNPHQIPKWVLLEQRHQRDDREGRPRWVPPDQRDRSSLLDWDTPDRPAAQPQPVPRKPWRPWQRQMLGAGLWWLILAVAVWILLTRFLLIADWQDRATVSALVPLLPVGFGWRWTVLGFPTDKRAWRRAAKRRRR